MASVFGFLYAITEPVLGPLRRLIPPIGMGGMGLDLSPTIVLFGLFILTGILCRVMRFTMRPRWRALASTQPGPELERLGW